MAPATRVVFVTTLPVVSSPVGGYQVLRLPFDPSNTDVKAGVALVNAGEMGVLACRDSLFVTYEGCSISTVPKVILFFLIVEHAHAHTHTHTHIKPYICKNDI